MCSHAESRMTVLCGHTHHEGVVQMLPNLRIMTGSAEYGAPHMNEVLQIV